MSQTAGLESIFASDDAERVRMAAALVYLWGCSRPYRRWLAREPLGDLAVHQLVITAYNAQRESSIAKMRAMFANGQTDTS